MQTFSVFMELLAVEKTQFTIKHSRITAISDFLTSKINEFELKSVNLRPQASPRRCLSIYSIARRKSSVVFRSVSLHTHDLDTFSSADRTLTLVPCTRFSPVL